MWVRLELSPEAPPDAAAAIWEPLVSATAMEDAAPVAVPEVVLGGSKMATPAVSVGIRAGGLDVVDGLGELIGELIELGRHGCQGLVAGLDDRRRECRPGWCW